MSRTQYTRAPCGACGKRGAYVRNYDSGARLLRCMLCGTEAWYYEGRNWPGLEDAAARLRAQGEPPCE